MHCDIVVATGPGFVDAIGGNVRDAVTRTRFTADGSGYLRPRPGGASVWFAVFENRLGRLPPWPGPGSRPVSDDAGPVAGPMSDNTAFPTGMPGSSKS
jgi:hypothetical protein